MNSFQILDSNNNAISIHDLDKEVCELTGNEVDPKWYCPLGNRKDHDSEIKFLRVSNWFDTIGWQIAEGKSFQDILDYYSNSIKDFIGKADENGNILTFEMIYPYHTKVINHWIAKGYIPKSIPG